MDTKGAMAFRKSARARKLIVPSCTGADIFKFNLQWGSFCTKNNLRKVASLIQLARAYAPGSTIGEDSEMLGLVVVRGDLEAGNVFVEWIDSGEPMVRRNPSKFISLEDWLAENNQLP